MAADESGNYYDELGVKTSATPKEITKAYKELVLRYHPDRHQGNDLEALAREKLKRINAAYEVLSNPQQRALYDAGVGRTGAFRGTGGGSFRRKSLISKVITIGIMVVCFSAFTRILRSPKLAAIAVAGLVLLFLVPRFIALLRKK